MKIHSLLLRSTLILLVCTGEVSAQLLPSTTTGTAASSANTNAATQVYNPVSTSDTKKTFSGTSFSSVGGAIAGCSNVGGLITGGVSSLFNTVTKDKFNSAASQSVATTDSATTKELKRANRTKECLDGVAYSIAKSLLQQVSNRTLNWVNKGLGGNPLYVQDVTSNLRTIRDEQLGRYLDTVQNSNPIFGNAIRSAVTKQVTGISDGYINKAMNTPEGKRYAAFQEDFTSGGWGALLNMNNNPIGAIFNSTDKIERQIAATVDERVNEIQRNNGFLDMRTCVEYEPIKLSTTTCNGGIPLDELPPDTQCIEDKKIEASDTTPKCLKYKTTTPGALIGQQVGTVLNSPTKQLEMADSINEVLGSFFDQLLNKLYQNGLAGLQNRNGGRGTAGGYGSNVVLGANGLPLNTGNTFGYNALGSGYDVQAFDISRPQQLRDITQAQYDFLNRATDSQIAMSSIVPTLGALDYCIPGPNPSWQGALADNYQSFMGSLDTPTQGRSTLSNILSTIPIIGGFFGTGDKEISYALAGTPILFDKVSGTSIAISPWHYLYYTKDYDRGVRNTDGVWIRGFIGAGYDRLVNHYETTFTQSAIINLFTAADPGNATYATGALKDSFKEIEKLISYNENLAPLDEVYTQAISDTEDAIIELEDIRAEALEIVKKAKARYIAQRRADGNPVNMACINSAYIINETPITGAARQEGGGINPMLETSNTARDYFYNTL
jgi:hypothetical protein